ncbi:hypothetical protein HYW18_00510 [Candidatus Uhrbacteria bacterium]|nr:hypothetical protein [Candidatus Uhrbacteria bacterium]
MSTSLSLKRIMGYGLGALVALTLIAPTAFAVGEEDTFSTSEDSPITASELLEVDDTGRTFGQVAGLGQQDLRYTIARIVRAIITFLGVVAVVIILWGGFKWMTSGGADEKVKDARKLIVMGIVGLAIVLSAYAIANFVITSLVTATSGGPSATTPSGF